MTKTEAKDLLDNYLISKGELSADDRIKEINAWVNLPRRKSMFDDDIDPILPRRVSNGKNCPYCGSHRITLEDEMYDCHDCGEVSESD